jgi:asparagine synthase (glutamine-hydrolysing)
MLDSKKFGALHTGQIGDLLFGSYIKKNFKPHSGIMSNRVELLQKISFYDDYEQKYTNSAELFAYEERVIHGTLNGDRTTSHFTDMLSPFYDRELIEFCLSIPDRYKKDEAIYLDWFNQKHPKIAEYVWESAGIKPKNSSCVKVAKMTKRIKNALMRRMGLRVNDMNPFDVWLRSNPKILNNLDSLYQHYLHCAPDDIKDLLDDIYHDNVHFSHYGRNNKFLVVTLLLALDLHFGDQL